MKQRILFATGCLAICLALKLQAQPAGSFIIQGKIKKASPSFVFLTYETDAETHIDSAKVTGGRYTFRGYVDNPKPASLYFKEETDNDWRTTSPLNFYLERGSLSINSDDSASGSRVAGGSVNADNMELQKHLKPLLDDWVTILKSLSGDETNPVADGTDSANAWKKLDSLDDKMIQTFLSFAKSHPNSFLSLYALQQKNSKIPDVQVLEPIFSSFSPAIRKSKPGLKYAGRLKLWNSVKAGVIAPQFSLPDTSGKQVSLHTFRGRYVLVDFWASWCIPCRAENPNVVKAYNGYRDKNFDVVSISVDQSKPGWIKAIHDDKLPWMQLLDSKEGMVQTIYDIHFIPQNYLIDPRGIIIARNLRGDDLQNKLREILNNQKK